MAMFMKVFTRMVKDMGKAHILGKMVENILGSGRMVTKMGKELFFGLEVNT